MYGKRLTLPLGAALLAALTFGPAQASQASAAPSAPKTVLSASQDAGTNGTSLAKPPPGPDHHKRHHHRHHHHKHHHGHHHHGHHHHHMH
ncbi:hypothetical protein [Planotetraspora sp. GP83]|uniref:hypothetical protein n=1 Tax=Planotetraspora sp. GP83 TaxID=3156264 RepID=UPI0035136C23